MVDVHKLDLDLMKEKTTEVPNLLPYPHHAGSAIIKPEDQGKITGLAVKAMHSQTEIQMSQIFEQMKLLSDQAIKIKNRREISERIYQSSMSFDPIINHIYFLYQRNDGTEFLSMISPEDWGRKLNSISFIAEIKLLADHTWEIIRSTL
jgi:hypothetical protein